MPIDAARAAAAGDARPGRGLEGVIEDDLLGRVGVARLKLHAGDGIDRLTVPYAAGGLENELCCLHVDRVALFEIRDKASPAQATIASVGQVTLTPGSVDGDTRVVLDSEALYVISRTDLLGGFWSNPEAVTSMRQE